MIEFDPTIRAMGLYKYIIYAFERANIIEAIEYNKGQLHEVMKQVRYYQRNIQVFAGRLRQNKYRWDGHQER